MAGHVLAEAELIGTYSLNPAVRGLSKRRRGVQGGAAALHARMARAVGEWGHAASPSRCRLIPNEDTLMLHYALVFLVIAIIAAVLGFGGIAGAAAGIAKILFVIFLILAIIAFFRRAS